jgi:hypothetical protein
LVGRRLGDGGALRNTEHAGDDECGQAEQGGEAHTHVDSVARGGSRVRLNAQHGLARTWFRDTSDSHENANAINAFHG